MLYQDSAFEAAEAELADPDPIPELAVRLWPHHSTKVSRLLTPSELDAALTHSTPIRRLKLASPSPASHHGARQAEVHEAHRHQRHGHARRSGDATKRLLDVIGALLLAVALSPLLLIVGLVLASDQGPILYSHSRTGRYGRTFGCLKFRTMVPNAEQALRELLHNSPELQREWMRDQKLRNDPRITAIGRFLRRTSLDELPQLWNVLRGDMSLVGPRPVVRDELQRYGRRLDTYLTAKPGVTGLWQVMGRSDTCYRRRVALDTYYVRKHNFFLDVYILLRTIKVVVRGNGAC